MDDLNICFVDRVTVNSWNGYSGANRAWIQNGFEHTPLVNKEMESHQWTIVFNPTGRENVVVKSCIGLCLCLPFLANFSPSAKKQGDDLQCLSRTQSPVRHSHSEESVCPKSRKRRCGGRESLSGRPSRPCK